MYTVHQPRSSASLGERSLTSTVTVVILVTVYRFCACTWGVPLAPALALALALAPLLVVAVVLAVSGADRDSQISVWTVVRRGQELPESAIRLKLRRRFQVWRTAARVRGVSKGSK